jgi:hypothetical protein
LYVFPGEVSRSGESSKTWLRGSLIDDPTDCDAMGDRLREANGAHRSLCRVAVWAERSIESLAALMRHELEHDRQLQRHGWSLQHLHDRAVEVLSEHAGGLPGSASLYQQIPMEADANAAAAMFVRRRYGAVRIDALVSAEHHDAAMYRPTEGPLPIPSLPSRMERFILVDGEELAIAFATRT